MLNLWRAIGIVHNIAEQLSRLQKEVAMIRARVKLGRNVIVDIVFALKEL